MELDESARRWLEISAAAVFVAILVLVSLIVVSYSGNHGTTITNSYNTYNYNINVNSADYALSYPSLGYAVNPNSHPPVYTETNRYLQYSSWSAYEMTYSVLGTPIADYNVYVKNEENLGGYFKVTYYFDDYDGTQESASETYYIGPHQQQKMVYKDVSPSEYKHGGWHYSVVSMTKEP